MSLAGTPDALILLLVAAIVAIVAVPLALFVLTGLLALLRRVGLDLGPAPGVLLLLVLPLGLLAVSMALDQSGERISGQVIDKRESVLVKEQGNWSDDLSLTVRFANDGTPLSAVRSTGAALGEVSAARGAMSTANLGVDGRLFARAAIGDPLALKVLPLWNGISVVRAADVSTRSLVPPGTLEWAVAAAAAAFLGWRLRRRTLGKVLLVGLGLLALCYQLVSAEQRWRERSDLSAATLRTSATVVGSTHVTDINLVPNDVHDELGLNRHTVYQPYDIVQLELQPNGYPGQVTSVDAVDASVDGGFQPGQVVSVVYAPDDPHGARMEGQTRTHYLRTTIGVYTDYALYIAAIVGLLLLGLLVQRQYRARKVAAQP